MKLTAGAPTRGLGGRQRMRRKEGNPEVAAERRGGAGGSSAVRTCGDQERGTVGRSISVAPGRTAWSGRKRKPRLVC
jgi:hypothetical protein